MENNFSAATENNESDWGGAGNGGFSDGDVEARLESFANRDSSAGPAGDYSDRVSDVVSQAKEYLGDKVSSIGEKLKGLATDDLGDLAGKAKDFARQKPGQAILVSAAAGVLLGLLIRGKR